MRIASAWRDFEVLDASAGEKLERWGEHILIRPDPQVIWNTPKGGEWKRAEARYVRGETGGGRWNNAEIEKRQWTVSYRDLRFHVRPTGFKHTGLFPEQAVNWDFCRENITAGMNVLNLFAYTGGATLACLAAGAQVCHVDASKGMVAWARENAALSGLSDKPCRWITDDCKKFVERELRRGSRYDGVIMDPPSYGRGPGGEIWKLEDALYGLAALCAGLLSDDARFMIINSYTTGLSASVMEYVLGALVQKKRGGTLMSSEIGLPVKASNLALPCGNTAIWSAE